MFRSNDASPEAQAFRQAAVKARGCPRCGVPAGSACKTPSGGYYNPRYNVHKERLEWRSR